MKKTKLRIIIIFSFILGVPALFTGKGQTIKDSLEMAVQHSDQMVFMKRGKVVAHGRSAEVFEDSLLERVYEMKMKTIDWEGRKIVLR